MKIIGAIRNRRYLGLLLGMPAMVITVAAMTVAPASAATSPGGKVSAVAHPVAPTAHKPASRKPLHRAGADDLCLLELGSFTPSATTVPVGTTVNLNPRTTCDIGPTIYWVQVFDVTTGTLVDNDTWGSGTSWNESVVQNVPTTHGYVEYIDEGGNSFPPANVYAQSPTVYVTWEAPPNNFQVSLSGPSEIPFGGGPATYVATANQNVGPTPYYIEIFDETTGARLAVCGTGTACPAYFTPSLNGDVLVAFVSDYDTALPPAGTQASSNILGTFQLPNIQ